MLQFKPNDVVVISESFVGDLSYKDEIFIIVAYNNERLYSRDYRVRYNDLNVYSFTVDEHEIVKIGEL